MKIILVGGARPNFVKIASIVRSCIKFGVDYKLVHTGQHYDFNMSGIFFDQLNIPTPDYNLDVGSSTHADQTAKIIQRFEPVCVKECPDSVVVVGDVNSTLACALVVSKMGDVKLAHVEAGLRCFDRHKPEEVNRVVTDVLSNYLFVTTDYAIDNLLKEGIERERIFLVGDTVLDSLIYNLPNIKRENKDNYVLATIHRPLSTDNKDNLEIVLKALVSISNEVDVILPMHPRTVSKISYFGFQLYVEKLNVIDPVGYLDFLSLLVNAAAVVTDSGGLQIETSFLGIPCISIMTSTSHLYTLNDGTNVLVGYDISQIYSNLMNSMKATKMPYRDNLADGRASDRIIQTLMEG